MATLRRSLVDVSLIVAALAAGVGVVATRDRPSSGELHARRDNLLAAFRPEQLERITIERGAQRVVIERGAGDAASAAGAFDERAVSEWSITEPIREPAAFSRVRELVSALEVARVVRRLESPAGDRAAFGLDAPRAVVRLELGTVDYRLVLGGAAVTPSGAAYLEVSGEGVVRPGIVIIPASLVAKLDVGVDEFRQRRLSPYQPEELERLVLEREGQRLALRRELKRWRFDASNGDRLVDRRAVERVLTRIGELDAERVTPVPEPKQRDPSAVRVVLSPSERRRPRVILEVGGVCPVGPGIIAARLEPEPIAGCVDEEAREALVVTPDVLLSRRPFSLNADEVEELVAASGDRRLELARSGEAFTLRAPREGTVELEAGNRRLGALVAARGALIGAADPAALGLAAPRASVTLRSSGASEAEVMSETVDVGSADAAGHVHLRRRADGAVLRLDADTARAFLPDMTLLERPEVFDISPKEIRRVEIEGGTRQTLEQSETGGFRLVEPAGYEVDAALATDLVEALAKLNAERWVADRDDGSFGLGSPALRVKVVHTEPQGPAEHQLVIGRATAGGVFAQVTGRAGVFVLARRSAEVIDRWLIDRSALRVPLEGVRRIAILTSGARLVLERIGDGFEQVEGADPLSAAEIQELTEGLAALHPEAALHPGAAQAAEGMRRPELEIKLEHEPGRTGPRHISIGAGGMWRGAPVQYARSDAADVTFVVARERVRPVLDLLR